MHQATTGADAASLLFDLPEYVVLDVRRDAHGGREVFIATEAVEAACPGCGVATSRVHQRTRDCCDLWGREPSLEGCRSCLDLIRRGSKVRAPSYGGPPGLGLQRPEIAARRG